MDSTSSGQIRGHGRNKRVWTPSEDEKLVECFVELCVSGKVKLEKMLEEKLPNSGLKVSPHIESRVKTLKKQFNAIMDMLTHGSGFSWDNAKKMVLCDQDVFEGCQDKYIYNTSYLGHKDANGLRLKPFPHFDDLSLVFGKDRELDQSETNNDIGVDDLEAEADASHTNTVASTPSRMEFSSQSCRKRAKNVDTTLINVMTRTCNALESLVGNFNQQMKRENRVVGELEKLPNLNRLDILKLSQIIMNDPMKVKLLFNLDEDLKVEWVKQLLQAP
ncbi:hypothetical protein PVL29_024119 [Vitis rotundifolia]|uniref:Myb/SANT-like domain-containing protein n=1 Tax=Vitis rotundifolia TaxID=103349 RepID=A0AA39D8W9_VITRO|nr:hypothetical protein PVL29_024119 [Vitis rotundifolia]